MCFWYIFQFGRLTPRCDFDCFRLDWYTSLCAYLVSHQPSQFSYSPQSHPASQEYHVIHMECSLSGPEIGSFSTYLESYGCCESIYFDQHRWDMVGWSSDIFLLNIFGSSQSVSSTYISYMAVRWCLTQTEMLSCTVPFSKHTQNFGVRGSDTGLTTALTGEMSTVLFETDKTNEPF